MRVFEANSKRRIVVKIGTDTYDKTVKFPFCLPTCEITQTEIKSTCF